MQTPVRMFLVVVLALVLPWVLLIGEFAVLIWWLDGDLPWELEQRGISQFLLGLGFITANAALTALVYTRLARIAGWPLFVSTVAVVAVASGAFVVADLVASQARGAVGTLATSAAVLVATLAKRPTARTGRPGSTVPAGT